MAKIERELSEHLANIHGEAMAGRVMSAIALDFILGMTANKALVLDAISKAVDARLSQVQSIGGNEELVERTREVARARCDDVLAQLHKRHLPKQ